MNPNCTCRALALAAIILGARVAFPQDAATASPTDAQAAADSIAREIEQIRGLTFKQPVRVEKQSIEDFSQYVAREMDEAVPQPLQKHYGAIVRTLGLYRGPPIEDFSALMKTVLTSQVGAYYDPQKRSFFVLMANLPDEFLRYDGTAQMVNRVTEAAVDVGGVTIPAGEQVFTLLGAANRDPARYVRPDDLDVTRVDIEPLTFGGGVHFCLGAALARAEIGITFRTLLDRFDKTASPDPIRETRLFWDQVAATSWRGSPQSPGGYAVLSRRIRRAITNGTRRASDSPLQLCSRRDIRGGLRGDRMKRTNTPATVAAALLVAGSICGCSGKGADQANASESAAPAKENKYAELANLPDFSGVWEPARMAARPPTPWLPLSMRSPSPHTTETLRRTSGRTSATWPPSGRMIRTACHSPPREADTCRTRASLARA